MEALQLQFSLEQKNLFVSFPKRTKIGTGEKGQLTLQTCLQTQYIINGAPKVAGGPQTSEVIFIILFFYVLLYGWFPS